MTPDLEATSTATHKRASSAILDLTTLRLQILYRQKFNGATPGPAHRRACIKQVHAWERRLWTRTRADFERGGVPKSVFL